jgi:hypothetical protein
VQQAVSNEQPYMIESLLLEQQVHVIRRDCAHDVLNKQASESSH